MALNILQAHAKAYLDLLAADVGPPALVVLDGENPADPVTGLPSTSPPYVLVYFSFRTPAGRDEPDSVTLEAASDLLYATATCHSVGGNAHAAQAVAGRVRAALLGKRPNIAGRGDCRRIEHIDGSPAGRDETTGTRVFDQADVYEFLSLPG